jgi:hypothetical protein
MDAIVDRLAEAGCDDALVGWTCPYKIYGQPLFCNAD